MIIEDFGGTSFAEEAAQIEVALSRQFGQGMNEFWLSHTQGGYPSMSILTKLELAALYYFPHQGHPGFASQGTAAPDRFGYTIFSTGSVNEAIEIPNSIVVNLTTAKIAAERFLSHQKLPECLTWLEL